MFPYSFGPIWDKFSLLELPMTNPLDIDQCLSEGVTLAKAIGVIQIDQ
jgi:hypothetical protein